MNLTGERDSESHKILNFGQRNSVDDELLRQRVLGLKNKSKTGRRFVGPRTSGPGNRDRSIVKSGNAGLSAVDSSEEEGRSALGKSRLPKENKARRKAKRVVRVETFAGMLQQQVRIEAGDDEDHDVVVPERYSQSEARNGRSRPHSFLDELLEAKKNKQRRKKRRKTQKNNEREALSNEEDDI